MPLATRSELKTTLGIADTVNDAGLDLALRAATAMLDRYCDRVLSYEASDAVEQYDGGGWEVRLKRWPVTHLVSVKEASDYNFAGATALTANTDFYAVTTRGRLIRLPMEARWIAGFGVVQVTYRGGYSDPGGAPVPQVSYPPAHIQSACLLQAAELWKRRREPGYQVVFGVGEVSGGYAPPTELLPSVKELLRGERRI